MRLIARPVNIRLIAVLLLCTLVAPGCAKNPNTEPPQPPISKGDQIIRDAKKYGPILGVAIEEGIKQEALLAANGTIDPKVEPGIRQLLIDAKKSVTEFNKKAATWDHFDSTSKDDITQLINDGIDFVEQIYNEGVLRIKNPQSQQIAAGILSGARVALQLWKLSFEEAQAQQ